MAFRNLEHGEAGLRQERARLVADLLAVLERAGGLIGDAEARPGERRQKPELMDELANVLGKPRHVGGALGIAAVTREQMAIVLDHGAAAGRGGEDGVELTFAERARPGIDIAPRSLVRLVLAAEMVLQRAAAGFLARHHYLDAVAPEQPDGGVVDGRLQHLLHAAEQERHALDWRLDGADHRLALAELEMRQARRREFE